MTKDTTINIQHGCPTSHASVGDPCSNSLSLLDFSLPFEIDYTKQICTQNNIDVKVNIASQILTYGGYDLLFNFLLLTSQTTCIFHTDNMAYLSNLLPQGSDFNYSVSSLVLEPLAIPY